MRTGATQENSSANSSSKASIEAVNSKNKAEEKASQATASIGDALEQMRAATHAIYDAFGAMGSATGDAARVKLNESRDRIKETGTKAEATISEKPLLYVGCAFAAGWLVSRLMK